MVELTWHTGPVPPGMRVRQVYGFLFDEAGDLLLIEDRGRYSLPGGKPEAGEDYAAVLRREAMEEATVEVRDPVLYLGHQRVDEGDGSPAYAQVRMVALLGTVHPGTPDPDTGRLYRRVPASPPEAKRLLDWGETGSAQVTAAIRLAVSAELVPD